MSHPPGAGGDDGSVAEVTSGSWPAPPRDGPAAERIAIIGAGYAGMACAVELAAAGRRVHVFEASQTLGGRARSVEIEGVTVDNGAHIFVGAYEETLRLMTLVGAKPARVLRRLPLHLDFPGEFRLAAPRLPAPLHLAWALLTARGLTLNDKLAALRFMRAIAGQGFRLAEDIPAAELLARHAQGERLRRYLWEPLCVAALNTEMERASAQVFLNVLRDTLAADRAASDLLLPTADFSTIFPEPAARYIEAQGGTVTRNRRITAVAGNAGGYRLDGEGVYDQVVIAVAPYHLPRLVAGLPAMAPVAQVVEAFDWEPIVTAYLAYPAQARLPRAMSGVANGYAQWLFDRGALCGQPGLFAAVISAHGRHEELPREELVRRIHTEIARIVPNLPPPRWTRIIEEKRATFACTPNLIRPATATPLPGLWLAGDYVAGDYPATLEGAVRSGVTAARSVLDQPPAHQS